MSKVFETLKERGYINNYSHDEVIEKLDKNCLTFYIGFDATADSLTLGHFVTIMAMMHMEKAGHRPIALLGGGTTMIGDPSGRNDMRQIMTKERIDHNAEKFREQISRFLDVENGHTVIENNANWLLDLNFVNFMREVGVHFGVNQMLALDTYKNRLEDGLTFFEMSYILMQAYDFLVLNRKYGCSLQMGGSDQWSNILAGVNLIKKTEEKDAYALTFNLLTTADGIKMGKTAKGAIWLDRYKTSPYDMFQYLRNVADADVEPFLKLLTFLDLDEIKRLTNVEGAEINKAKEVLAYEVVNTIHGKEDADAALSAARSLFAGNKDSENIPTTECQKADFENGKEIIELIRDLGFVKSNGEGRRLIQNGGISLNDEKVADFSKLVTLDDFKDDKLLVRKGKKTYHQIKLV